MFKQLKRRQLTLNVVLMIIIMSISFLTIYAITYQNTNNLVDRMMTDITNKPPRDDFNPIKPDFPQELNDKFENRLVAFSVNLSKSNELLTYTSTFETTLDHVNEAVAAALETNIKDGRVEIDDSLYQFRLIPRGEVIQIHFIDISTHMEILTKLIYTFLGVSVGMTVVIIVISNYLTNESIKPIKKAFDQQNQFISDASHELKTPLAVIQANTDVLVNEEPTNKWLSNIQSEVLRMKNLTESLLDLSRIESVDYSDSYECINVSELCEQVTLALEAVAFEKSLKFDYAIEDQLLTLGKYEQLEQVLMILLDNAFKYTNENGLVHLSATATNSHIHIKVKNEGTLISEEDQIKIFDRFYKIDASRSDSSYGLGLAIAKSIILRHHGKLLVKTEDHYNVFEIKLQKK